MSIILNEKMMKLLIFSFFFWVASATITGPVPGPLKEPKCASGGWLCDPETSIRNYYQCIDGVPYKLNKLECDPGFVCAMSGTVPCVLRKNAPAFKCVAPGNFEDPKSCTLYHHCWVCHLGNLYDKIITCPATEYYHIQKQTCVSKLDSDCVPL